MRLNQVISVGAKGNGLKQPVNGSQNMSCHQLFRRVMILFRKLAVWFELEINNNSRIWQNLKFNYLKKNYTKSTGIFWSEIQCFPEL